MGIWLGVMSGTSLDGVDVAAVRLEGTGERPDEAELVAFRSRPYEDRFRDRLERGCREAGPAEMCALDVELGRRFAREVGQLLDAGQVDPGRVEGVGSHGQTVWHAPGGPGSPPPDGPGEASVSCTLQLGEAAVIAEETGLTVIADFRVRDVAAGGQGAPLTPYFDRLLLTASDRVRAVQNLGGMGNVTVLPPAGDEAQPVAFDTGPGVALIDEAVRRLTGGEERFDRDGELAAGGRVREEALEPWMEDPFFRAPPPRSTGRERFGPERLEAWMAERADVPAEDLVATLTELTARTVARAVEAVEERVEELVLCGGGARNPELVRRIRERIAPIPVLDLSELGWNPDAREAAAFALLARQHELGVPASAPWATGARGARILGKRTPA